MTYAWTSDGENDISAQLREKELLTFNIFVFENELPTLMADQCLCRCGYRAKLGDGEDNLLY